jgi:hypothetical protein
VRVLSFEELDQLSAELDRAVLASHDIDRFCSASDWILPAARQLMPLYQSHSFQLPSGFAALVRAQHPGNFVLQPLEAMWGLACPIVGDDVRALTVELADALERHAPHDALLLCGVREGSPRFAALVRALSPRYQLRRGPIARRFVASLEGGLDGFLARRSANLRVGIKRARRRAAERGVRFENHVVDAAGAEAAYRRLLAVEQKSWKGREGVGLAASTMEGFYRQMMPRLGRRGAARLMFATCDGEDVSYIFGGVFGDTYRGLQFGYATGFEDCALGNLGQVQQIAALCQEESGIRFYDLGAEVDYKKRWGELVFETVTVIGVPVI